MNTEIERIIPDEISVDPEPAPIDAIIRRFPALASLRNEDLLDLKYVPVDPKRGEEVIRNCHEFLTLGDNDMPPCIAEISRGAFEELYLKACGMWSRKAGYIIALKIYFGVEEKNPGSLSPIFQPLYLKRNYAAMTYGQYNVAEQGGYFAWTEDRFVTLGQKEFRNRTNKYRELIEIKRPCMPGLSPHFIPGEDVEAVIFPFQTIFTLIVDNNAPSVFLYNAYRKMSCENNNCIRHSILLFYKNLENYELANYDDLVKKYANRSHLCPPDCSLLEYTVYKYRPDYDA